MIWWSSLIFERSFQAARKRWKYRGKLPDRMEKWRRRTRCWPSRSSRAGRRAPKSRFPRRATSCPIPYRLMWSSLSRSDFSMSAECFFIANKLLVLHCYMTLFSQDKAHPLFKREGHDLHHTVKLPLRDVSPFQMCEAHLFSPLDWWIGLHYAISTHQLLFIVDRQ